MLARSVVLSALLLVFLPLQWAVPSDPPRASGTVPHVANVRRYPHPWDNRRIYVTYGGNVIFRFPNYAVRIDNFHQNLLPGEGEGGTSVVFHNQAGMYWDGRGLIITPNYSAHLLTMYRYAWGVIGDPQTQWPALEPSAAPEQFRELREYPSLVGYRSLADRSIEGYVGPDDGPAPQPQLEQRSYVLPLKPQLGLDGKIEYVPTETAIRR